MTDISTENLSEMNINSEHRGIPTPNASNSSSSSAGRTSNSSRSTPPRLCSYFAQGNCRNGQECRFSHDLNLLQQHQQNSMNNQGFPQNQPQYPTNASPSSRRNNYQQNNNLQQFQIQPPHSPYAHVPILNNAAQQPPPSPIHNHHQNYHNPRQSPQHGNYTNYGAVTTPPPPMFVNVPANQPVYCIDVECVATGIQHNARAVAQVAMVDQWSRVIYNAYIKQDVTVVSYLTEIHGITAELLEEKGIPLADALAELRSYLSPSAILIGQSIHKDIHWLQLVPGIDFHSFINLSDLFRVWNPQHYAYTNFSLDHCAKTWLGIDRKTHEAIQDAIVSMSLFNAYRHIQWFPMQLMEYQHRTLSSQRIPGFSSVHPVIDGCCMGNRKKCVCGAPFE